MSAYSSEIVQYDSRSFLRVFIAFKETDFYISFAILAVGVVPFGGPKSIPEHPHILLLVL